MLCRLCVSARVLLRGRAGAGRRVQLRPRQGAGAAWTLPSTRVEEPPNTGLVYGYDKDGKWYFNSNGEMPDAADAPAERKD